METKPTEISSSKMFGGYNKRYKHFSPTLGCSMTFHIYFPPSPSSSHKFPVLYWLSGLTCTDENFITKSGAQRAASSEGVALIVPDTSPSKTATHIELIFGFLFVDASFNYKSRTYTHEVFILLNAIRATCNL
jgi:S-formylglutathione hydrolase FrmB